MHGLNCHFHTPRQDVIRQQRPVVFRCGMIADWEVMRWTPTELKRRHGACATSARFFEATCVDVRVDGGVAGGRGWAAGVMAIVGAEGVAGQGTVYVGGPRVSSSASFEARDFLRSSATSGSSS